MRPWTWLVFALVVGGCTRPPAVDRRVARFGGARAGGDLELAAVWGAGTVGWQVPELVDAVMSPDGRWVVIAGARLQLVEVATGAVRAVLGAPGVSPNPGQMSFSADGRRFAVADGPRRCVAVWSVPDGVEQACVAADARDAPIALSPDGTELVTWGNQTLARWKLAGGARVWSKWVAPAPRELRWPTADRVIAVSAHGLAAVDARTGDVELEPEVPVDRLVGMDRGAVLVLGDSGLVRIELATGDVAILDEDEARFAALLPDGGVVTFGHAGEATRRDAGGRVMASFRVPEELEVVAAGGARAVLISGGRLSLWDLTEGRPVATAGVQLAPVIALAADEQRVIAAAADGSLLVRGRDGAEIVRRQATAVTCDAWAISRSRRRAACSGYPGIELLALDETGGGISMRDAVPRPQLVWLGEETLFTPYELIEGGRFTNLMWTTGRAPSDIAAIDDDEVAVGGIARQRFASIPPPTPRYVATGLAVWRRGGGAEPTVLDAEMTVTGLAAGPDIIATVGVDALQLWSRPAADAPWRRRWIAEVMADEMPWESWHGDRDWIHTIALSDDGSRVAVVESLGGLVTVRETGEGRRIGRLELGGAAGVATALAFAGDHLFVGTSGGQVLELRPR